MHPMHIRSLFRRAAVTVAVVAAFAVPACGGTTFPSGTDPVANASRIVTAPPTISPRTGCDPGSVSKQLGLGFQVRGVTNKHNGHLYALFGTKDGVHANTEMQVWWRVSGDHALLVTLVGPDGQVIEVRDSTPEPKPGWTRAGEPWVSTLTVPSPGCWRVFVKRGTTEGDLWLTVS
ncbi:MAG: hypothetical protein ACM3OO_12845 [Planctomycetaceae bacterium]